MKDEGESLERLIRSLEKRTTEIPQKIEAENESVFESVCSENAQLIGRNMSLEDRLQKAEATLIETKLDYAQSENEKESLYKKLSEFKKLMG